MRHTIKEKKMSIVKFENEKTESIFMRDNLINSLPVINKLNTNRGDDIVPTHGISFYEDCVIVSHDAEIPPLVIMHSNLVHEWGGADICYPNITEDNDIGVVGVTDTNRHIADSDIMLIDDKSVMFMTKSPLCKHDYIRHTTWCHDGYVDTPSTRGPLRDIFENTLESIYNSINIVRDKKQASLCDTLCVYLNESGKLVLCDNGRVLATVEDTTVDRALETVHGAVRFKLHVVYNTSGKHIENSSISLGGMLVECKKDKIVIRRNSYHGIYTSKELTRDLVYEENHKKEKH